MAELAKLVNMPIRELQYQELGSSFKPRENKKYIESDKERHDVIQSFCKTGKSIKVYANKKFKTTFDAEIIEVVEGENIVPPLFAIHLLMKYGIDNRYGGLAKLNDTWVSDEPVFDTPNKKHFDFAKKANKTTVKE